MIKSLLIAAALLSAGSAFASKARVGALGGAPQIVDFQNGFDRPEQFADMNELVTFEFGGTNAQVAAGTTTNHSEGGFLRKHDAGTYGFYLGRMDADFNGLVNAAKPASASLMNETNAWNLLYGRKMGDMKIGFDFHYSNAATKTTVAGATTGPAKESTMGFSLGASQGAWDAHLIMGLSGVSSVDATPGTFKLNEKSATTLAGGYHMDTMYFYGSYKTMAGTFDTPAATVADQTTTNLTVSVIDTMKKDGVDFFYGISYGDQVKKDAATGALAPKTEAITLPIIIGVEAEAASWLTLRGSITQDTGLLGGTKIDAGTDSTLDNTTVAAGVGIKFNKFTMDGTLATTKGNLLDGVGANGLAANTSLTYNF